jgi:hypothetical protein
MQPMTLQKERARTEHSGPRPLSACVDFLFLQPWGAVQFGTKNTLSAVSQRRRPRYTGLHPHIIHPRSVPSWQGVASFSMHLAPSTCTCQGVVSSRPLCATLIMSVGWNDQIERRQGPVLSGYAETLSYSLNAKIFRLREAGSGS